MASNQKPHAIMISYTLQGHITPFVNLAIKLASKGFSITFAHTELIHYHICKSRKNSTEIDIFSEARKSGLEISYKTISDGFPLEFDRVANMNKFLESFLHDFPKIVDEFVGDIIRSRPQTSSKNFLIADTLYSWPAEIAKKYGLVNVSFWTEPALVFSLYYHLELLRENGHVPVDGRRENVEYVPGIRSINTKDFMTHFHDSVPSLINESMFRGFEEVKKADFILCNTVQELEQDTISALQKIHPFYAVGPLFSSKNDFVPRSLWPESDCTEWLNGKPPGSVLYISFGSLSHMADKTVIDEIAGGILLSEVNFVWVLRPAFETNGNDYDGILPQRFEESTKDRGMIVPWCTQNRVLSNPSIGGFLTHCGWNSILESIWCGIPMLCYPLFSDQSTNRKLVVDDWRIGINLGDGGSLKKEEVEEKIRSLMSGTRADELRQEIKNVQKILQNAVAENGSSERNFDHFAEEVTAEIHGRSTQHLE